MSIGYADGQEVAHVVKLKNHAPTRPSTATYAVTVFKKELAHRYWRSARPRPQQMKHNALTTAPPPSSTTCALMHGQFGSSGHHDCFLEKFNDPARFVPRYPEPPNADVQGRYRIVEVLRYLIILWNHKILSDVPVDGMPYQPSGTCRHVL